MTQRKVLAIDDNATNLALIKVYLQQMDLIPLLAESGREGFEIAIREQPDLILMDIMMPDLDGYETCRLLKSDNRTEAIPVIFLSAKDTSDDKVEGLGLGAVDYIAKPFDPAELQARIKIILQMVSLQERLIDRANTDELTGLANRRAFMDILQRALTQASLKDNDLSLIMLDIDHFKSINDTYGHLGGDVILQRLAEILKNNIYTLDVAARYGGEEFIIILPECSSEKAMNVAERLRRQIEQHEWKVSMESLTVTVSIGVTSTDIDNQFDEGELIRQVDIALYAAKRRGRNCVVCWKDVNEEEQEQKYEVEDLRSLKGKIAQLAGLLHQQAMGTITALAKTMKFKDPLLAHHAENVKVYTEALAKELKLPEQLEQQVCNAALLHDIGKIGIPSELLTKTTALTEEEQKIFRRHPIAGVQIISPVGVFQQELNIIRHHHENFDGSGYPDGLTGRRIPFGARILAVANTFDSMTSDRWHRSARTMEQALAEIRACAGSQFDPDIVAAFMNVVQSHGDTWPLSLSQQALAVS